MLLSSYGSWSITAMMAGFTVVSLISVLLLTETAGRGLGIPESIEPSETSVPRQRLAHVAC